VNLCYRENIKVFDSSYVEATPEDDVSHVEFMCEVKRCQIPHPEETIEEN